ncbi:hypothetical protein EPA93_02030 [Ktedonosporobacter rubrisoli]|uniref:Uncharacterized protein n=1 Tax=Ktedonosporobacter rubrisoli TaxID=2509675 RepID=A0A4P6JJK2_KTERU|nr:hypothetical protein [Ktedonosporobacter rubrisoli]QBD74836.1 hypothetical protein EPA93_02030 [Ktedonosporobacter rubrisoli]
MFDTDLYRHFEISIGRKVLGWVQPSLSATLWTPLPETLLLLTRYPQTHDTGFALLSLGRGKSKLLIEEPAGITHPTFSTEVSIDGSSVYVLIRQNARTASLWQLIESFRRLQLLCSL